MGALVSIGVPFSAGCFVLEQILKVLITFSDKLNLKTVQLVHIMILILICLVFFLQENLLAYF